MTEGFQKLSDLIARNNEVLKSKKYGYTDDQVFDNLSSSDPQLDYTGFNAAHYIDMYVNRPEDRGDLEAIQSMLSTVGIVAPPADAINAALYAIQGEWGMSALSVGAIVPILGDMAKAGKSSEKMVTLYRAVPEWYPGKMVKNGKFIGGPGKEHYNAFIGNMPAGTLWTSEVKIAVLPYAKRKGPILKFKVPESYIKKFGVYRPDPNMKFPQATLDAINKQAKYTIAAFPDGLPKEFLEKVYKNADEMMGSW